MHPDVAYITPDRPNKVAFDDALPAVLADVARVQYALDGSGIGIAVIDSGVYSHDDLQKADGSASRIVYSESFVPGDLSTGDPYGHGTHVAGILAGNGRDSATGYSEQYTGVAPKANIINLRALDANGSGSDSQVIAAIQRAIQLKNTYNIRVINLSLGRSVYESYTLDPLCQAVEAAWKAGIVVVVAAGNAGRDNTYHTQGYATIQAPGNDPNVITVGATKTSGTTLRGDDTIASYSSKGPTLIDHVVKPDLVAPGNRIVSLLSPGSNLAVNNQSLELSPSKAVTVCSPGLLGLGSTCTTSSAARYLRMSGTSMATPVVAAAAALMIQKDPTLTPDTVKARMMKTAWKNYPVNSLAYDVFGNSYLSQYDVFTIGAGYLDVDAVLGNHDVTTAGTPSPLAVRDTTTGKVSLLNGTSVIWGNSVIWGQSLIWGNSVVWGGNSLLGESVIWGDSVVWGNLTAAGSSVIWGQSVVWGGTSINCLSSSEDGEN
jgi:serine protease AprX